MKVRTLRRKSVVRASMRECWAFFSDPANLSRITPPSLDFRVISDLQGKIYAGMMIQYRVRPLFRIPVTWLTEITHVREPHYFADEQRAGPYVLWHHEHFFENLGDGRVEVRDLVHYALPFGFLGDLAHGLVVQPQLEKIFNYREKVMAELFGA